MAAIDRRPLRVKALHWAGMMAVCSPAALLFVTSLAWVYGAPRTSGEMGGALAMAALTTFFAASFAALIAQKANSGFDLQRPEFPQFLKGLAMVPAWIAAYGVLIIVPIVFFGGLLGAAFWLVRRL